MDPILEKWIEKMKASKSRSANMWMLVRNCKTIPEAVEKLKAAVVGRNYQRHDRQGYPIEHTQSWSKVTQQIKEQAAWLETQI